MYPLTDTAYWAFGRPCSALCVTFQRSSQTIIRTKRKCTILVGSVFRPTYFDFVNEVAPHWQCGFEYHLKCECLLRLCIAFAKWRRETISIVMSVCPSVRVEQHSFHWRNFQEIWHLIFRRSFEKIPVRLNSEKNKGYFTWRPMYIYDHISLSSS